MKRNRILKKSVFGLTLAAAVMLCVPAMADTSVRGQDPKWNVVFTQDKEMDSNFHSRDMDDVLKGLQPGDDAIFYVNVENDNSTTVDWYMENAVLKSLEESEAAAKATDNGAYTYYLSYTDKNGTVTEFYNSETVGGDSDVSGADRPGLKEATGALENYFYLDTLKKGEGGMLTLRVALDGETQGNNYQDTLAQLQLDFAVELNEDGTTPPSNTNRIVSRTSRSNVVKTGDTNMAPYALAGGIAGIILLLLAIFGAKKRKKERAAATAANSRQREGARR